jgi:hypothetical protein
MSETVTVNVNSGARGGGGGGLLSALNRLPWWVTVPLLIVIGFVLVNVVYDLLARVYDFALPSLFSILTDPRAAGSAISGAAVNFFAGAASGAGGSAGRIAKNTRKRIGTNPFLRTIRRFWLRT